jgi:carboxymethylenebutenolidase
MQPRVDRLMFVAWTLVAFGTALGAAPPPASQAVGPGMAGETVTFASGDAMIEGYMVQPRGSGKHAAVVVIHDSQGLDSSARNIVNRLGEAGYVALAPDLLSRIGGTGKRTPEEIMQALGQTMRDDSAEDTARAIGRITAAQTVADVKAAFGFLEKSAAVDAAKVSAIGLGWGSWRTFMLAGGTPRLHRAVVFYGSTPDTGLDSIAAPVLAHYAQFDFLVTGNAVWTRQQLGSRFTYHVYPTGRGFLNEAAAQYDEASSKLAWTRTLEFLRR